MLTLILALLVVPPDTASSIRAVLTAQQECWNRGDLDGFMRTYLDTPELTFSGRKGLTRGYQAVAERYRLGYPTRATMGQLSFSQIEVQMLGPDHALVLGRFELVRAAEAGGPSAGFFSLVLRRTAQGWKILHDHTS
jgi:uncharacterized protein (TIGR02246 family)